MRIEAVRLDLMTVFVSDDIMWPVIALLDAEGRLTYNKNDAVAFVAHTGQGPFTCSLADVYIPTIH